MKNKIYQSRLPAPRKSLKPSYEINLESLRGFRLFAVVYNKSCGHAAIYGLYVSPRDARKACKALNDWYEDFHFEVFPLEFPRYYFY